MKKENAFWGVGLIQWNFLDSKNGENEKLPFDWVIKKIHSMNPTYIQKPAKTAFCEKFRKKLKICRFSFTFMAYVFKHSFNNNYIHAPLQKFKCHGIDDVI